MPDLNNSELKWFGIHDDRFAPIVRYAQQQSRYTCWAASLRMIMLYRWGSAPEERDIEASLLHYLGKDDPTRRDATDEDMRRAIEACWATNNANARFRLGATHVPYDTNVLWKQFEDKAWGVIPPIVCFWPVPGVDSGHACVVTSVYYRSYNGTTVPDSVRFADPGIGKIESKDWHSFVKSARMLMCFEEIPMDEFY